MHKKILVLGGTGAMGEPLTQILVDKQYDVYVTSRVSHKNKKNLTYLLGNAHDKEFLEEILCEHFDVIVDFMEYGSIEKFRELLYVKLNVASQYIYCSSGRVYADSDEILCEDSPLLTGTIGKWDLYAANKIEQENELKNSGYCNWTIIRPYITYNIERLQLGKFEKEAWLYRAMKKRSILLPKEIKGKMTSMSYGRDVASAIEKLFDNENAYGNIVQISTEECMSWEAVLRIYLFALEKKLSYRPNVLYYDEEQLQFPISSDRKQNRRFDNSKLRSLCNTEFVEMEVGLRNCIDRFIDEQREFQKISWYLEGKMDLLTGEMAQIDEITSFKDKLTYVIARFGDCEIFKVNQKNDIFLKWKEWVLKLAKEDYKCMEKIFEKKRRIGIYALSNMAKRIINAYCLMDINPQKNEIIIYDSAENKWGLSWGGHIVKKPEVHELVKLDILIVSSDRHYNEIYLQYKWMEEHGIEIIAAKDIINDREGEVV